MSTSGVSNPGLPSSTQLVTVTAAVEEQRKQVIDLVIAKARLSQVHFASYNSDIDFQSFEDDVYGQLVCYQLDFLMDGRNPNDDIIQKMLRAKLLSALPDVDRHRLSSYSTFTELWARLKKDARQALALKADGYKAELFSTKQLASQGLVEFIKSRQELYVKLQRASHPVSETDAVQSTLRKLRHEFTQFAHEALYGTKPVTDFDALVQRAAQMQSLAESAEGPSVLQLQLQLDLAVTELGNQKAALSKARQVLDSYRKGKHGGHGNGSGPAARDRRREQGKDPPSPCTCGGMHWRADCPTKGKKQQLDSEPAAMVASCEVQHINAVSACRSSDEAIYLDSCATRTCTPHGHLLHNYKAVEGLSCRSASVCTSMSVLGSGMLHIQAPSGAVIHVDNVLHVPDLQHTLISTCRCARAGVYVNFNQRNGTGSMLIGKRPFTQWREEPSTGLPRLTARPVPPVGAIASVVAAPSSAAHASELASTGLEGIQVNKVSFVRCPVPSLLSSQDPAPPPASPLPHALNTTPPQVPPRGPLPVSPAPLSAPTSSTPSMASVKQPAAASHHEAHEVSSPAPLSAPTYPPQLNLKLSLAPPMASLKSMQPPPVLSPASSQTSTLSQKPTPVLSLAPHPAPPPLQPAVVSSVSSSFTTSAAGAPLSAPFSTTSTLNALISTPPPQPPPDPHPPPSQLFSTTPLLVCSGRSTDNTTRGETSCHSAHLRYTARACHRPSRVLAVHCRHQAVT